MFCDVIAYARSNGIKYSTDIDAVTAVVINDEDIILYHCFDSPFEVSFNDIDWICTLKNGNIVKDIIRDCIFSRI